MNNEYLAYGVTNICCTFGRRIVDRVTNICCTFGRWIAYGVDKYLLYLRTPDCRYNNHPRRMPLLPKAEGRSAPESSSYLAKLERLFRTNVQTTIFLAKKITLKQA